MCAISLAARAAISRTTVRIVPSAGSRTLPYARSAARAIAAAISTGSTSSPGREISSSAAPRISWREDHAGVAARAEQRRAGDGVDDLLAADLVDLALRGEVVELLEHGAQRQRHVVARVAVGDREDVEVVDLLAARFKLRESRLDDEAEAEEARVGHGFRGRLLRLGYLASLEAARADVNALRSARLDDTDLLDVDVKTTLRRDHRVRAALAKSRALTAGVTNSSHRGGEYRTRVGGYRVCDAPGHTGPHLPARPLPRRPASRQRRDGQRMGGARRAPGPRCRGQTAGFAFGRGRARAQAFPARGAGRGGPLLAPATWSRSTTSASTRTASSW